MYGALSYEYMTPALQARHLPAKQVKQLQIASEAAATGATRFTAGEKEEEEEAYGVSQSGMTGGDGGGSRSGEDVVRELVGQAMRATGRVRAQAAEVEKRLAQLRAGDTRDRQVRYLLYLLY